MELSLMINSIQKLNIIEEYYGMNYHLKYEKTKSF